MSPRSQLIKRRPLRLIGAGILVLALFLTFTELGIWQLHRAQEMKSLARAQPEQAPINLNQVSNSAADLRTANFNRLVTFPATLSGTYLALHQSQGDYQVAIARLQNGREVLLVWGKVGGLAPRGRATFYGRLYPPQTQDVANGDASHLSRLDPALLAQVGGANLMAGYVIATSFISAGYQTSTGLSDPQQLVQVGVPYYQHIAYVITWWFMALLVLLFPFYNRMRAGVRVTK